MHLEKVVALHRVFHGELPIGLPDFDFSRLCLIKTSGLEELQEFINSCQAFFERWCVWAQVNEDHAIPNIYLESC